MERARIRVVLDEEAEHGLEPDRPGPEAGRIQRQALVRADQVDLGHGGELAAPLVKVQRDVAERLEPGADARAGAPGSLRDRTDPSALRREQVEDPVRLAEPQRAQDDGLRPVGPGAHGRSVVRGLAGIREPARSFWKVMARITVYSTDWCGYCERAKQLLRQRGLPFDEVRIDEQPAFRERLYDLTGGWTVPQIVIDDRPIGGFLELWRLDREGELERLAA